MSSERFPVVLILVYAAALALTSFLIMELGLSDRLLYFFLIPSILSAFLFRSRWVYLSMQVLLGGAAVWVMFSVSSDFQASVLNIAVAELGGVFTSETIHTLVASHMRVEETLRRAELEKRTVLESISEIVVYQDVEGSILWANRSAGDSAGLSPEQLLGCRCYEIWAERQERCPDCPIAEAIETGRSQSVEKTTPDGRAWLIRGYPAYNEKGEIVGGVEVAQEITERKRAEDVLERRAAQLEALREVGLEITAELDLDDLLRSIVSRAIDLLGGTAGGLDVYRADQGALEFAVTIGLDPMPSEAFLGRGEGLSGRVLETGQPIIVDDYQHWEGRPSVWEDHSGSFAVVAMPICWGDELLGVLKVLDHPPRTFSSGDAELLSMFANQAAIAVRNARLYENTNRRLAQTQVLREVMQAASSTLDFDKVLERTVKVGKEKLDLAFVGFALPDENRPGLVYHRSWKGYLTLSQRQLLPFDGSLCGRVFQTGEPMLVGDVRQCPDYYGDPGEIRSELVVPVYVDDEIIGVLNVESRQFDAFDEDDLDFYMAVAGQLGVALENARFYQQEQDQRKEAETLRQAALALTTALERDEVIERILAQLQEVVPYDTASVQLLREGRLQIVGGRGFPNLDELLGITFDPTRQDNPNREVVRTREPFIVEDASATYEEFRRPPHAQAGVRSWLGVPMVVGERLVGMIALDKQEPGFYAEGHARLAEAFAAQAAIAVENSRLFLEEREQRKMTEALEKAAALVSSTLDLDQVLDRILEQVALVVAGDACNIMLIEDGEGRLVRWRGYESMRVEEEVAFSLPIAEYPNLMRMVENGEPVVVLDTSVAPGWVQEDGREEWKSYIGAPIRVGDMTVGFLNVNSTQPRQFSMDDARRLEAFARHAATAIENAQLYRQLRDHAEKLEERVRERTAQLEAQFARLEAILDSTADGIVVTGADGRFILVNPVAKTWFNQTLLPKDAERLRREVRDQASQAEEQPRKVLELTGLDLELRAAPISGSAVGEAAAVVVLHDVSHLKALDRMKTRFVSNVSHELRTPIATIKLFTQLMQRQPERWREYLKPLAREVEHQARLVEDILEISRVDAGRLEIKPRPMVLNDLAEMVINSHERLAEERGLTLTHDLADPRLVVLVDHKRLMQVLNNLMSNAIRYTPEGGGVTLSTGTGESAGRSWATVTVADTGMGIPEDELPYIFDRFYRGEKPRSMQVPGTGLGLAIVKEIVDLHGGQVTVKSEVGRGSEFTVWLPLAGEEEQRG